MLQSQFNAYNNYLSYKHGTSPSPVQEHLSSYEACKSNFSCNNFSVVDSGKHVDEIIVKETFHIKYKKQTSIRTLHVLQLYYAG